jgi:hypothetical protein
MKIFIENTEPTQTFWYPYIRKNTKTASLNRNNLFLEVHISGEKRYTDFSGNYALASHLDVLFGENV